MSKDYRIEALELTVAGRLSAEGQVSNDHSTYGHLAPTLFELWQAGYVEGECISDGERVVAINITPNPQGRDYLEELKAKQPVAKIKQRLVEEGIRIVVAIIIAIVVYHIMDTMK